MDPDNARLEEYKALRAELMRRQGARETILGLTTVSVATLFGVASKEVSPKVMAPTLTGFSVVVFAYLIVIAAITITSDHTQMINLLGAYIRESIESKVEGLNWHTHRFAYRRARRGRVLSRLPLGASKPLAIYYLLLSLSAYGCILFLGFAHDLGRLLFVSVLALIAVISALDLYVRFLPGWGTGLGKGPQ